MMKEFNRLFFIELINTIGDANLDLTHSQSLFGLTAKEFETLRGFTLDELNYFVRQESLIKIKINHKAFSRALDALYRFKQQESLCHRMLVLGANNRMINKYFNLHSRIIAYKRRMLKLTAHPPLSSLSSDDEQSLYELIIALKGERALTELSKDECIQYLIYMSETTQISIVLVEKFLTALLNLEKERGTLLHPNYMYSNLRSTLSEEELKTHNNNLSSNSNHKENRCTVTTTTTESSQQGEPHV